MTDSQGGGCIGMVYVPVVGVVATQLISSLMSLKMFRSLFIILLEPLINYCLFVCLFCFSWRNASPTTTHRETVRKMEPKYPVGGHCPSVLRPRGVFKVSLYFL